MRLLLNAVAACCLLLGAVTAAALDCKQAATPIEETICRQADLLQMDVDMNRLYGGLRSQLTAKARTELLTQQRTWLAERDRACANGEIECLRKQYRSRLDQLEALNATAEAGDQKLDDVTPVIVKGKWKATAIQDPASEGPTDEHALRESLARANLPKLGTILDAVPGKLCFPPQPCDSMGWTQSTLAVVNGGAAIGRYLGLSPSARVLVGSSGATQSYYLLVPRSDGTLWAVFALCGPVGGNCRKAAEIWSPASPDASVVPSS
jgi:uncharacterized protein